MSNIFDNKYWPNAGGTLGQNKVAIPDGVTTPWPEGDALVENFVYKEGKLNGFIDTKALILNDSATTTINYDFVDVTFDSIGEGTLTINRGPRSKYFNVRYGISVQGDGEEGGTVITFKYKGCKTVDDVRAKDANYLTTDIVDGAWTESLADLENGKRMFDNCYTLTTFKGDLSSLTDGTDMFSYAEKLASFESDLPSLTNGKEMFCWCKYLTTFDRDLSSLTDGDYMFQYCSNLTTFTSNLSSLTDGDYMFTYCSNLITFDRDLSSLTDGSNMFSNCTNLTTFTSDLSSLTDGYWMFCECRYFTTFSSDLSSLTDGRYMFYGCKLDSASVKNIIDTINNITSYGALTIGIGCDNTTSDKDLFAQEIGYADMTTLLSALQGKGWTVTAQYNGRPTSTYSLRQPAIEGDLLPVFVKLEEVEEHADYTSMDETKKYRLDYFHETTGSTDGYTQYATLEEAIESLSIKPIER